MAKSISSKMSKQELLEIIAENQRSMVDLKKENKELFNAWLYYWSNATQGAENPKTMDKYENGKYQRILDGEMEGDECWTCCNTGTHKTFRDSLGEYEWTCDACHKEEYPEQYLMKPTPQGN